MSGTTQTYPNAINNGGAIARRGPDLVPVFPEFRFQLEMWLALNEDLRASRRLRLMMDHLAAGLTEYVAGSQA